jgi:orotate phosphoribosyltransferase
MAAPSRSSAPKQPLATFSDSKAARARLAEIIRKRSFGRGEITLVSGRKSNFYFNMKPTMLDPEGAALIARLVLDTLGEEKIDYVGGLEMGAVPIVSAVAAESYRSANGGGRIAGFFVRKKPKEHGVQALIEGLDDSQSLDGRRVMIVEDVTTTGGSILQAVEAARAAGAEIAGILTVVDRNEGAGEAVAEHGLELTSLFTAADFAEPI